jgi:hypothetical protein
VSDSFSFWDKRILPPSARAAAGSTGLVISGFAAAAWRGGNKRVRPRSNQRFSHLRDIATSRRVWQIHINAERD